MDILCNIRTCRKPLTGALWVTSCSHSFCEEHASSLTLENIKCPACDTVLGKRFDVIRQNSNPTKDFRAMLLVGLRPEIVLDIAKRAISFWNYQMKQELKFQSSSIRNFKEVVEKSKDNHVSLVKQLTFAKKTRESNEKQIGDLKSMNRHLKDQICSKDRQLQQLQELFNSTRNETNSWQSGNQIQAGDSLQQNAPCGNRTANITAGRPEFVFEPRFAPKKQEQ